MGGCACVRGGHGTGDAGGGAGRQRGRVPDSLLSSLAKNSRAIGRALCFLLISLSLSLSLCFSLLPSRRARALSLSPSSLSLLPGRGHLGRGRGAHLEVAHLLQLVRVRDQREQPVRPQRRGGHRQHRRVGGRERHQLSHLPRAVVQYGVEPRHGGAHARRAAQGVLAAGERGKGRELVPRRAPGWSNAAKTVSLSWPGSKATASRWDLR